MATITKTLKTLTFTAEAPKQRVPKPVTYPPGFSTQTFECPADCPCRVCPPGCPCKTRSSKTTQMVFYVAGVIISILAMYLMISTDSKLYLVFWVVFSVLRRMILKTKKVALKAKTD